MRTGCNSEDKLFDTIIFHDMVYLPEEIKTDVIWTARADPLHAFRFSGCDQLLRVVENEIGIYSAMLGVTN